MRPARLFALALVARLAFLAIAWCATRSPATFETPDSPEYIALAGSLLGGSFAGSAGPEIHRTPGYPLLVAAGLALGSPRLVTLLLQAAAGAATALLVFASAPKLGATRSAATLAALVCVVEPVQLAWGSRIMAEGPLTLAVTAACAALLVGGEDKRPSWLAAAAALAAVAAYLKPVAEFLPIVLAIGIVVREGRRALPRAALVLAVGVALLVPWVLRNAVVAGYPAFSSKLDRILAYQAPAALTAAREARSFADTRRELGHEGSVAELRSRRADGVAALRAEPGTWLRVYAAGLARTLLSPGGLPILELLGARVADTSTVVMATGAAAGFAHAQEDNRPLFFTSLVLLALHGVVLAGAAWALLRRTPFFRARLQIALVAVYFIGLGGGPWGQSRFRCPSMPLVLALAASALPARSRPARPAVES